MRVSEFYHLDKQQSQLDFVNVVVDGDSRLYIDPLRIRPAERELYQYCDGLLADFFETLLGSLRQNQRARGLYLLTALKEPNDTRLGVSQGRPRGHGMGRGFAEVIWDALRQSKAAESGLLEDLEDTAVLIPLIGPDLISDMVTNIIREPLIRYTQEQCYALGIPMTKGDSGHLWDPNRHLWVERKYELLPRPHDSRLLLVPKDLVQVRRISYDAGEYETHFILPALQQQHLEAGTALVERLKNGKRRVTKKTLRTRFGKGKPLTLEVSRQHPEVLAQYRKFRHHHPLGALSDDILDWLTYSQT
jgi:hypothetical protein